MSGFDKVSKKIQKYDELHGKNVSIDEKNAYLYGCYYAGTQRMASRVEFMPQGMGEEPQQPEQAEQPDSQEQASEMASGQPSKEEKEAMREYQKLQKMEVAKVEASGGSESASGTEESEAVEPDLYYYHTDHLGSTTFITDRNGDVAQYLAYTPYGETFIEERDVTPYKFNDSARREQNQATLGLCRTEACLRAKHNGKELDAETGLYYYGARYYDPSAALWLGVDPLAEKYPDVSPYVYCHGNPVVRIDPDGRDEYDLNESGNIVARRENNSADIFRFVDKDGKAIDGKSISFKSGTVENARTQKIKDGSMDVYKVRGDDNAKKLYEFVVDGTKGNAIEWSWFETGEVGNKGLNFISTIHMKGKDASGKELFIGQLSDGYSIRSYTHNHPSGIAEPSEKDVKIYNYMHDYINWCANYKHKSVVLPKFKIYTDTFHDIQFNLSK